MTGNLRMTIAGLATGAWLALAAGGAAAAEGEAAGFGVVVSADGDVLAPFHVAASCESLQSPTLGRLHVMHADSRIDLAHLMAERQPKTFAHFADSSRVNPGDELTVLEPAPPGPDFATRTMTVKALIGSMQTASFINVIDTEGRAPGDALLLDGTGGLVGFIVRDIENEAMFGFDIRLWAGPMPDGATLPTAVGEMTLRHFLDHHRVAYATTPAGEAPPTEAAPERVLAALTPIECGR